MEGLTNHIASVGAFLVGVSDADEGDGYRVLLTLYILGARHGHCGFFNFRETAFASHPDAPAIEKEYSSRVDAVSAWEKVKKFLENRENRLTERARSSRLKAWQQPSTCSPPRK